MVGVRVKALWCRQWASSVRLPGRLLGILALLCALGAAPAEAATVYVRSDGNDAASGASWADAKATLWAGTTTAVSGDQVWVAKGTYPYTFAYLRPGIQLYGGFNGTETDLAQRDWKANETVLTSPYWATVYIEGWGPQQRLDGFTIRNSVTAVWSYDVGDVVIKNNTIVDNYNSGGWHAGIVCHWGGTALITDNRIENNVCVGTTGGGGGGIGSYGVRMTVLRNTITRNYHSAWGGGVSCWYVPTVVEDNVITENGCGNIGSAINLAGGGTIRRNVIARNASPHSAIWVWENASITDNTLQDNVGTDPNVFGSAVRFSNGGEFLRNTLTGNHYSLAGGLRVTGATVTVRDNTFRGNTSDWGAGGIHVDTGAHLLQNNLIESNWGGRVGGVMSWGNTSVTMTGNTIRSNWGNWDGGVRLEWSTSSLTENTISNNAGDDVGGMNLMGGSVAVRKNIVQGNWGRDYGAVLIHAGAAGTVRQNTLIDNNSFYLAGVGIWNSSPELQENVIRNNRGNTIGAIGMWGSGGSLSGNTIEGNAGPGAVGGIHLDNSSPGIVNNRIAGNSGSWCGGVNCFFSSPTVLNNTVAENESSGGVGGINCHESGGVVANNLVRGNRGAAAGVSAYYTRARILNNTIVQNTGAWAGGGIACWGSQGVIASNLVALNNSGMINFTPESHTRRSNCVWGNAEYDYQGLAPGSGDLQVNPCMVDAAHGRFDLTDGSLCIDAGATDLVQPGWTDLPGLPRVANSGVDIGAFEFQGIPDFAAPTTTAGVSPAPNEEGWNSGEVTVTLSSVTSHEEGVASIRYSATGAQTIAATTVTGDRASFQVSKQGETVITFFATDHCGHVEAPQSVTVRIDRTAPDLTAAVSPGELWPPNGKMVPVTVTGSISDALSGLDGATVAYRVVDEYGQVQPSGTATVAADGTFTATFSLQARRAGNDPDGRTYAITLTARDAAGNLATRTLLVSVAHDQGKP
jgi:hypothetical protein